MGSAVAVGTLLCAAATVGAVGSVALRYELSAPARATLPVTGGSGLRIFPGRVGGLPTAGAVTVEPGRRRGLVASTPTLTFSTSQFLAR
ncbi:hypothetical protein ACIO13_27565 [Streptomyces sp. NPDC087425]|uniref:hypothetical protein n=1 Tax=Streptomyces sp. NPDC087425 TaxID=3365787 RepID=UPI0037FD6F7E